MGFALPAGIGSTFDNKRAIVISGDGGLQMNIQELEVIKRRNLPIKIIVMNNSNLGMVRTFQELYFENRLASTVEDYSAPNFTKIAQAYNIDSKSIDTIDLNENNIKDFLSDNKPKLLNIKMSLKTQVEPRLQFGNPLNKQCPFIEESD